jgi:membrane protease YdiL (CAAX protease family)
MTPAVVSAVRPAAGVRLDAPLWAAVLLAPAAAWAWHQLAPPAAAMAMPDGQGLWMLLLVAPVLEEIVFRAGLQAGLVRRGWRPGLAIVVASAAFAAWHLAAGQGPAALAVLLPSLVFGHAYARHGLACAMACHAWFNACHLAAIAVA